MNRKIKKWKLNKYKINFFSLEFIFWNLYFFISVIFAQEPPQEPQQININNYVKFKLAFHNVYNKADTLKNPVCGYYLEKSQEVYILDRGNNRVVIFGENGEVKFTFPIVPEDTVCLTVDEDENTYLLANLADARQSIYTYNFRGDLIEEYKIPQHLLNKEKIIQIGKIKIFNNYMFMSDVANNQIIIMSWDTKEVKTVFGGEGDEPGFFKHLTDFEVDKEGNTYVIDMYVSKISKFSFRGEFLTQFGEPGGTFRTLSLPMGIAINQDLVTFVSDSTRHTILAYNNKGEFLFEFGGYGKSEGWLYYPKKIFAGGNKVFIIEPFLNRVQMFELQTKMLKN